MFNAGRLLETSSLCWAYASDSAPDSFVLNIFCYIIISYLDVFEKGFKLRKWLLAKWSSVISRSAVRSYL